MDLSKYAGEHFVKVDDVKNGPIESEIALVKDGKYDKPNVVLETGDVLSLNATNFKILSRAYGMDSDVWLGKTIRLFLGTIQYQGSDHKAVLVEPISPPIKKKEAKDADAKPVPDMNDEIPF
jgi:hypothetical protein